MNDFLEYVMLATVVVMFTVAGTVCVFRPWLLRKGLWNWKRGVSPKEGHEAMLQLRRDDPAEWQRVYGTQILAVRIMGVVMYAAVMYVLLDVLFPNAR